jgi:hypothetical protein
MEAAYKETSKKADRFGSEHPIVNEFNAYSDHDAVSRL